jgi:hypothetical protein
MPAAHISQPHETHRRGTNAQGVSGAVWEAWHGAGARDGAWHAAAAETHREPLEAPPPTRPNAQAHLAPSAPHYRTASRPRSLPPRAGPSLSVRTACKTRRAARSRREEGEGGSHRTQGERGRGRSSMRVGEATPARPSDTFPC